MKLSYIAELIVELAVGMFFARTAFDALGYPGPGGPNVHILRNYLAVFSPILLSGVSAAGGVGLVVEAWRGRSPERWGVGRWTWAIAPLYTLASSIQSIFVLTGFMDAFRDPNFTYAFVERWRVSWSNLALLLVVSWLTARLAHVPRASGADAREWSGRILIGAIIIQSLIEMASTLFPEM